ncbi:MAG: aminotransferase class V-fold PLP-dependent enzyme [Leptospiraceae bacterium]|nr:aminotransferase class V-fold PLP-dependent enzyme [Leptospiraceae bacterium]
MNRIAYFDYNATHPPFTKLFLEAYTDYAVNFFNPSGATRFSLSRQSLLETVRSYFGEITKKDKNQFVFCSTGTEANALLIASLVDYLKKFKQVYISPFEHSSFYSSLDSYQIPFELLATDKTGKIDLNDLESKMKKNPAPVFTIYAANETGVIQPMQEIHSIAIQYEMPIFSDLMQAFGKIEIDFSILEGFTFSGHKIGAGMGASLAYAPAKYLKKDLGIFKGGNQENNHRAGTENSASIQVFKSASKEQLATLTEKNKRLNYYKTQIEKVLNEMGAEIIAPISPRLPSTVFTLLPIEEIDFFMMGMEEANIVVSTGSSCKSRTRDPSFSLLRMGYSKEEALRAIRISSGYFTLDTEVERLLDCMSQTIQKLR